MDQPITRRLNRRVRRSFERPNDPARQLRRRTNPVVLDTERRFLFVPNDKVCQTSIVRDVLQSRAIVQKDSYARWRRSYAQAVSQDWSDLFKFTVVRNPFDRTVSAYHYLCRVGVIERRDSFAQFCELDLATTGPGLNRHLHEQADALFAGILPLVDFIGRFEALVDDWPTIAARIGTRAELPHNNATSHADWRDEYTPAAQDVVCRIYARDFALLGYNTNF